MGGRCGGVDALRVDAPHAANGIDTTFGEQGKVVTPIGNTGNAAIVDLEVLGTGAILALGNARQENEPRIALARYTPAGVLDAGFGIGGKVVDDLLADGATATAMARAADGSILVTGQIRDGATQKVFLRRFSANGTPDLLRTYTLGDTGLRDRGPDLRAPRRLDRDHRQRCAGPLGSTRRRTARTATCSSSMRTACGAATSAPTGSSCPTFPEARLPDRDRRQPGTFRPARHSRAQSAGTLLPLDGGRPADRRRHARRDLRRR